MTMDFGPKSGNKVATEIAKQAGLDDLSEIPRTHRGVADAAKGINKVESNHDGFLGDPAPAKPSASQSNAPQSSAPQSNAVATAPAPAAGPNLGNLEATLRNPEATREEIKIAIKGAMSSGPDGVEAASTALAEHFAKEGTAKKPTGNMESTARALRDAMTELKMSEGQFQEVSGAIAYRATERYIEEQYKLDKQRGALDLSATRNGHLGGIQNSLKFGDNPLDSGFSNKEHVTQAIKDAVQSQVASFEALPDKGPLEHKAADKLRLDYRLGDNPLAVERAVGSILMDPALSSDQKIAQLDRIKDERGMSEEGMRNIIGRESDRAILGVGKFDLETARKLNGDFDRLSKHYSRGPFNMSQDDAMQDALADRVKVLEKQAAAPKPTVTPPAPAAAVAPVPEAAASVADKKTGDVAPAKQPEVAVAQQLPDPKDTKIAALEAELKQLKQQEADRLKAESDKLEAERKAAEARAQRAPELQREVGALLSDPAISAEAKADALRQIQEREKYSEAQMQKDIIGPAIKGAVVTKVQELSREDAIALKKNLEDVAVAYSGDERLQGEKSLARAVEKRIEELAAQEAEKETARDQKLNARIDLIIKLNTFEGKLEAFVGLTQDEMAQLRKLYGEKFKDPAGNPGNLDEYMRERAKISSPELSERERYKVLEAYLAGDPVLGKAYQIYFRADWFTPDSAAATIGQIYSNASPKERAAIVDAYNQIPNKAEQHRDFWTMADYELDPAAVAAMKKLPTE